MENPDRDISKGDMHLLIKQKQQPHVWVFSPKLWLYSMSKDHKNNWWNRTLRNLGEAPVIFDSTQIDATVLQMGLFLQSKGHFHYDINTDIEPSSKRQKTSVVYHINTGDVYRLNNISLKVEDNNLKPLFADWHNQTLLHKGMFYDVEVFDNERKRITEMLLDKGFFAFNKSYIDFEIDSSFENQQMDVTLFVRKMKKEMPNGSIQTFSHPKYFINDVFIVPSDHIITPDEELGAKDTTIFTTEPTRFDSLSHHYYFLHDKPISIAPGTITQKIFLTPGNIFRKKDMEQTYNNLTQMKVYKYIHIEVEDVPTDSFALPSDEQLLNCRIDLIPAMKHTSSVEAEFTTSSNEYGIAGNIAYQNKNIFGGAELFSIKLRGAAELQALFNKETDASAFLFETYELQLDGNLEIPRFLAPISQNRISKNFRPKTLFNIGFNYQDKREDYYRYMVTSSFGYSWRNARSTHNFYPIEANSISIFPTDSFQQQINDMSETSPRLKYQYDDHFILDLRYIYTFSSQTININQSFNFLRASAEAAGNGLYLMSTMLNADKNSDGFYQFFNQAYAQYIRFELDMKRQFYLGTDKWFVLRGLFGLGIPYLNSKALPYEKGFYGGGTNNMRAWPLYLLGPGSYSDPTNSNMERVGDNTIVINGEFRFPIYKYFKGALFIDSGNIWLDTPSDQYPGGEFKWDKFVYDFAIGGGFGARVDLGFFLIRLDMALPLRDPAQEKGAKWVVEKNQWRDIVFNFGIGYPF